MIKIYFAYGANMDLESMSWRCPRAVALGAYHVRDWRLEFNGHATVVPNPGSRVSGVLWAITHECEQSLDRYEGYPIYYKKCVIQQPGFEFMMYQMNETAPSWPSDQYVDNMRQSYRKWELDLDEIESALARLDCAIIPSQSPWLQTV